MIPALPLSALGSSGDITDTNLTEITYTDKQTGTDSTDSNGNRFRQADAVGATRVETDQSKPLRFTVPMGFRTRRHCGHSDGCLHMPCWHDEDSLVSRVTVTLKQ